MPAPVVVTCTADVWTKVATSVIAARVWFLSNAPTKYLHTYVATGGAAPIDLSKAVEAPHVDRDRAGPSKEFDFAELSDLYVFAQGGEGSVRMDAGAGGGGFDAAIAAATAATAVSTASIDGKVAALPGALYTSVIDVNFVVGDSPATIDINAALGRNSSRGFFANDGLGDISIKISEDGTPTLGDAILLKNGETLSLDELNVDQIQVTWVANSAYRCFAK